MPLVDVSATEIRERVRRGLPVGELVPPVVEVYIQEHGLYRDEQG
jgi:nicotinic acid mononucleotide adenylyltransferase